MKKLLSVLMALALVLVPVLSLADAVETLEPAYLQYTHTDDQYSFMYPDTWTLLNKENIQTIMEAVDAEADAELAQMIATYGPQIQQSDMVMLLSETGLTNVNAVAQYVGMHASDNDLLSLAPSLVAQLSGAMAKTAIWPRGPVTTTRSIFSSSATSRPASSTNTRSSAQPNAARSTSSITIRKVIRLFIHSALLFQSICS